MGAQTAKGTARVAYSDLINGAMTIPGQVRNEPVQARSSERIDALLDAASAVVAEVGIERLTTAMVAERASASIGTVYRYYPDRIAVIVAMSQRGFERFLRNGVAALEAARPATLDAVFGCLLDAAAQTYRSEPGFTSIRLADQIVLPEVSGESAATARIAAALAPIVVDELGLTDDGTLVGTLDVALSVLDALVVRAFVIDPAGDPTALAAARTAVAAVLAPAPVSA